VIDVKILAIIGSPHKGNTLEKTQRIEDKLKQLGDVEFEYIHLKDMDIKPCKGCFMCFIKGEDSCPLHDDKEKISHKMEEADGVIFATPVYSMHVSYLLKTFIDRFAYNFHRPRYFGKYAITLAVSGGLGLDETLKYLKMVADGWGFEFVGQIGLVAPPKNTPMQKLIDMKDRTDNVVGKFHTAIKEKQPRKLALSDHINFRLMQTVYSRMETMSPTDYRYFKEKGWFDNDVSYFYDNVRGSYLKDRIARIMSWIMGQKIDKAIAKLK
jgi:multimeric flavodoxin WrbA